MRKKHQVYYHLLLLFLLKKDPVYDELSRCLSHIKIDCDIEEYVNIENDEIHMSLEDSITEDEEKHEEVVEMDLDDENEEVISISEALVLLEKLDLFFYAHGIDENNIEYLKDKIRQLRSVSYVQTSIRIFFS